MTIKWLVDSKHGHFMWPLDVNKPTKTGLLLVTISCVISDLWGCVAKITDYFYGDNRSFDLGSSIQTYTFFFLFVC